MAFTSTDNCLVAIATAIIIINVRKNSYYCYSILSSVTPITLAATIVFAAKSFSYATINDNAVVTSGRVNAKECKLTK